MDENESLNERLAMETPPSLASLNRSGYGSTAVEEVRPSPPSAQSITTMDLCQWQVGANGTFRPAAKTVSALPAGAYAVDQDNLGPFLRRKTLLADEIIELPDTANHTVLQNIKKFWDSEARYRGHGLIFKRGVLLWGPPGSGKTVTIHLLLRDIISKNGVAIFCTNPDLTGVLVSAVRKIEPARPLIVVFEDIDEIISHYSEHQILSMLDGENQTDNIVYLATTNYPERLGARIVNRPSRFDERIFVGMPGNRARETYLRKATSNGAILPDATLAAWTKDTEGLSIAHLRELVAAVLCLDQSYPEVLARLKSMAERPQDVEGFTKRKMGLLQ